MRVMLRSHRAISYAAGTIALLTVAASPTRAGGPPPGNRSLSTILQAPGVLTYTVTDHGQVCGLGADTTATWVLRVAGRVFCSRNDQASEVSYPSCDGGDPRHCVSGGLASLTEASPAPDQTWLQYKYYGSDLTAAFPGQCSAGCSTTILPACAAPDANGQFYECGDAVFFDCGGGCDAGFCSTTGLQCTGLADCDLGVCTPTRSSTPGVNDGARGTRFVYDVVVGLTPGGGIVTGIDAPIEVDGACQLVACGDGYVDADLGEACDAGTANGAGDCTCDCSRPGSTTTTEPTGPTTTTTMATTPPPSCSTARCIVDAVLSGACAGEPIPPAIAKKLDRALAVIERAGTHPKGAKARVAKALARLERVQRRAKRLAKQRKLSTACADGLAGAVDGVIVLVSAKP
jgi:hypothetical protein